MGFYRQIAPGVYVDEHEKVVHVDVPELIQHYGCEDTTLHRRRVISAAIRAAHKVRPDLTTVELHQ